MLTKGHPADPSESFNLGNMLRAHGRNVEAEAALRSATPIDRSFAEAWYNLGDLLGDQGRSEAAVECLRKAVQVAPQYSDVMFNLALLLQRNNHCAEAADYWRRYLAIDSQSEWSSRARRSLKFCEMQQHLTARIRERFTCGVAKACTGRDAAGQRAITAADARAGRAHGAEWQRKKPRASLKSRRRTASGSETAVVILLLGLRQRFVTSVRRFPRIEIAP